MIDKLLKWAYFIMPVLLVMISPTTTARASNQSSWLYGYQAGSSTLSYDAPGLNINPEFDNDTCTMAKVVIH
jgi:hypothetical protein